MTGSGERTSRCDRNPAVQARTSTATGRPTGGNSLKTTWRSGHACLNSEGTSLRIRQRYRRLSTSSGISWVMTRRSRRLGSSSYLSTGRPVGSEVSSTLKVVHPTRLAYQKGVLGVKGTGLVSSEFPGTKATGFLHPTSCYEYTCYEYS